MSALGLDRGSSRLLGQRAWLWLALMAVVACSPSSVREALWAKGSASKLLDSQCVVSESGGVRCALPADEEAARALRAPIRSMASGAGQSDWARCAATEDGRVACWGCSEPIGQGLRRRGRAAPKLLPLANVKQVAVGQAGACALNDAGAITCWGDGFQSRSTDVTDVAICQPPPGSLRLLEGFPRGERLAMTADGRSCVMTSAGEVFCQGYYYLPDDDWFKAMAPVVGLPAPMPDARVRRLAVPRARDIVAGREHFCALGVDGSVTCWDENAYGQCGAPTELCVEYLSGGCKVAPFRVALGARAIAVSAGAEHSCALLEGGDVACWGRNENGSLGFRSSEVCHPNWRGFCDPAPKRVDGVANVIQLVASKARVQTWALTASGRVLVWPERVEPKPPLGLTIGPCRHPETALPSEQIVARERELRGQRLRVRGRVVGSGAGPRLGPILLQHGLGIPHGEQVVVDGKLMGFLSSHGDGTPLGLYVYDACVVRPPK